MFNRTRTRLRAAGQKLRPSSRVKIAPPPKVAAPFYLSPEWRGLMDEIIVERFGSRAMARCEDPQCTMPWRRGIRVIGDHIIEIKDGGALLDKSNVLCRCGSCHTRKTARARAARLGMGV